MFSLKLLILIIIILYIYWLWSRRHIYILSWKLNGPTGIPFLGSSLNVYKPENLIPYLSSLNKTYELPIKLWIGLNMNVFINDPISIREIFNSTNVLEKSFIYDVVARDFGFNLVTLPSKEWKIRRRLMNSAFNYNNILSFIPIFNEEADIFVKILQNKCIGEEVEIESEILYANVDIAYRTFFGFKYDFQTKKRFRYIVKKIELYQDIFTSNMNKFWNHIPVLHKLNRFTEAKQTLNDIKEFFKALVWNEVLEEELSHQNDYNSYDEPLIIHQLVNGIKSKVISLNEFHNEIFGLFPAAYDTSATAEYYCIMLLAMHPEYQEKVYEELKAFFPTKEFELTNENLSKLVYLDMVINESMRLLPPIPHFGRKTSDDVILRNGILIPKNVHIFIDLFNYQRNEKYWGEKANEFYPDHFLPQTIEKQHPYTFIPFTKGIRSCIGQRYAMMSLKIFLGKVFRSYGFKTTSKLTDLKFYNKITLKPDKYPKFEIYNRE